MIKQKTFESLLEGFFVNVIITRMKNQSQKMPLQHNRLLRRILAQVGSRANPGNITITHPFAGTKLYLHSFRHKGYWFYGKRREADAMEFLRALVLPGATVMDVGAHIGFVTLYLAKLVGAAGSVYAFEPGANNLPYLLKNCAPFQNVHIEPCAVGEMNGTTEFYLEDLSGQNNSLVADYAGLLAHEHALGLRAHVDQTNVPITTLDAYCAEHKLAPTFIKIDVEGAEFQVLRGAVSLIETWHPHLLVEMNLYQAEMFEFLRARGYVFFSETRQRITLSEGVHFNIFCLHESHDHPQRRV